MASWAPKLPSFGQAKSPEKDETSLTTLLSAEQCADLTFLIATITASMRQSLLDTFTAEELPSDSKATKSEEDALKNAPSDLDKVDVTKDDKVKKERQSREEDARKELAQVEVQELKKDMLRYFDGWRGKVIGRVGEIVNSREAAKEQTRQVEGRKVDKIVKKSEVGMTSIHSLEAKDEDEEKAFRDIYPPVSNALTQLDEAKRALILHSLVLILLSLEHYSAHSRILILHLTSSLDLNLSILKKDEESVAQGLLEAASQQLNADAETKKAAEASQTARKWKVGLASVAGAALIGVTGGLAAPLLAAGVGSVMGGLGLGATAAAGYLGTLAGSTVLVGGLFGAYGAKMTGKAMDAYAREVEDFAFIPIHRSQDPKHQDNESRRLRVAIAISGWLREPEEVSKPWRYIGKGTEGFALRYELEALLKLGHSLETFVTSAAWGYAKKKIIEQTIFATLTAALWPLGLLKVASVLDNPFSVAKYRAEKAGEVLADALINKVQGERPVTLVGYSLGARLIFSCLQKLADRKAFGLIENVVLLGAPCPSDAADWRRIRAVVSGRVVNVFSKQDYILGFLYRTSSVQLGVAGLQPVVGVHGVQNVDVTDLVDGHLQYRFITGSILRKIGFEDVDIAEVERAEAELKKQKEEEEKERRKNEGQTDGEGEDKEKLEGEVQKKNEQSIFQLMQEKTQNLDIAGFLAGGRKDNHGQEGAQQKVETK
ncbi:Nn.00g095130.m01.CDS01 [Neocucurbitaria sp. VM-36]